MGNLNIISIISLTHCRHLLDFSRISGVGLLCARSQAGNCAIAPWAAPKGSIADLT
ncbi:MAG: hypothetical protein KME57_19090 [Scytonema hyalinum WJT4-NPBG1]|nr:hypothetical protein [Scytonema hyalinum WJT4-NPBG1]